MKRSSKVCFAAVEAAPYAKVGGLADVAAALPPRLVDLGHEVRLFLPYHRQVARTAGPLPPVDLLEPFRLLAGCRSFAFTARTAPLSARTCPVVFIDCPELFDRPGVYTDDEDEAFRFALFSRAVIECCRHLGWAPDLFHCHDWHTALIPLFLRTVYARDALFRDSRSLLTVHNLAYQGDYPWSAANDLGLDPRAGATNREASRSDRINFLRAGIVHADAISTVSPTYAREVLTPEYGAGLHGDLLARDDPPVGILNGIDYDEWDPETDPRLPHRYSALEPEGKHATRRVLRRRWGLDEEPVPLVAVISRLVYQKGLDLAFEVLPDLLAKGTVQVVALGSGEPQIEAFFAGLERDFPRRARFHRGYREDLPHFIHAASDLILMPSRYEPCGLNQMYGMRYGTLPVARRTGGLADTIRQTDPATGTGTGFLFDPFAPDALRTAFDRAVKAWRDRALWHRLRRNAMLEDSSWDVRALPYGDLYLHLARR